MSMSAHERRVLAEMARRLAAQDPELASALSAWSEPASDPSDRPTVARQGLIERWCVTVRGWQRFPGRVAAFGGLLWVAILLLAPGGSEPVPPGQTEAAIFTEQVPEPGPALVRVQGP